MVLALQKATQEEHYRLGRRCPDPPFYPSGYRESVFLVPVCLVVPVQGEVTISGEYTGDQLMK